MAKNRINLIPHDLQPRTEISKEIIPTAILVAFLIYAPLSANNIRTTIQAKRVELARLQSENQLRHEKIESLNIQQTSADAESEKFKSLQNVLNHKSYWSDVFKELSILTPKDVWLTTLTSSNENSGRKLILRGEATSQKRVADFFAMLEKSQHFNKAVVNFSELDAKIAPELFQFELAIAFPTGGEL